jgi:hypothetical protein
MMKGMLRVVQLNSQDGKSGFIVLTSSFCQQAPNGFRFMRRPSPDDDAGRVHSLRLLDPCDQVDLSRLATPATLPVLLH